MGSGASAISEGEEEGPADTDEMFRRLFAAIDVDPSKAPPTPPAAGEGEGPASWGGWLAMVLDLRASQVPKSLIASEVVRIGAFYQSAWCHSNIGEVGRYIL